MFDLYCPDHGSRVLLFSRDIQDIRNTPEGIAVDYRCFCGYRGVWHTGRKPIEEIEIATGRELQELQTGRAR